ncbi:MAG: putative helicase, partial [Mycobacterium sp.]|nr:putative helicase [Mycobacterium sp.]
MSSRGYEEELRDEQSYVTGLYSKLDAERARVKDRYSAALKSEGGTLVERDVEVRALAKQQQRLDVADHGLCFGRLDADTGERMYIGRIGILGDTSASEPL